jgi:ribonuclease HII
VQPKKKRHNLDRREKLRLKALMVYEDTARKQGFCRIAGIDEAGRGPLAGPVVAAACIIPEGILLPGVNDSKKLTPQKRGELFAKISQDSRIFFSIGIIAPEVIDEINIYQATIRAMFQAIEKLICKPDLLLVDGMQLQYPEIPAQKIIGGDGKSHAIAAASIIVKETRDRLMCEYHEQWPKYGFDKHKGYGTEKHLRALAEHGPCPIHRKSFAPIKKDGVVECGDLSSLS